MIDEQINYLKNIYDEENDRQKVAEGKCAQIVSNSGIFLTLIGLLITLLYNAQDAMAILFKIILVVVVTVIITLYLRSMWAALEGLNPLSYRYSRANPTTVHEFSKVEDFKEQIVKDYLISIDTNQALNSEKLSRLAQARKTFVVGVYLTGALTFGLIVYLSFFYIKTESKPQKIELVSPIYHTELEKVSQELADIKKNLQRDTLRLKNGNKKEPSRHAH
ncbi:hypothetical protein SAMN05216464_110123 [Mucilaginibacter pineti]|uniref:Uncharacterized protein n=1 Tax=Mucilaginibacter pineti TaxID=1391627 RepID=A0A1G7GFW2_9SPHI|nr:hypothetical protein [Mucilaginibacter pineti]SDE86953.1 hypothetical protein SAMN05216464_110123 [Mucilaginibacter pineti]